MVVMILERVPVGLRGELTQWMIEPKAGVFVGEVSALVREKLWERACRAAAGGAGVLLYNADTEQGYAIRTQGTLRRAARDYEGLVLVCIKEDE